MRRRFFLRLLAIVLALSCCLPAQGALADEAPVLYQATAVAAVNVYPNVNGTGRALVTIPRNAELFVTSSGTIQGADTYYAVLYQTTRGFASAASIRLNDVSVRENDESIYIPVAYGAERSEVVAVQEALKELGFYSGKADGIFGAGTRSAVLAYQKMNGLKQTGAADVATQTMLFGGKSKNSRGKSASITTAAVSMGYTIATGHTGEAVRQLQQRLSELGYYKKTVDGKFGSSTAAAVKAFQKAAGLKQTGKADPETQQKLVNPAVTVAYPALQKTEKPTATPKAAAAAPTASAKAEYPFTTYTLASVNLRKSASASSLRLLTVPNGAQVVVSSVSSDFVKATYKGTTGYIAIAYVFVPAQYMPGKTLPASQTAAQHYVDLVENTYSKETLVLQEALKELGFYTGTLDGVLGSATVGALKEFQKKNGLRQDGIASPELQEFILEGKPLNSKGKKTDVKILPLIDGIDLRQGDRGEQVTALQHQLIAVGVYTDKPTGIFDSNTYKAVRQFQIEHSLYVDGVVGKKTRQILDLLAQTPTPAPVITKTPKPTNTPTPTATKIVAKPTVKVSTATPVPANTPLTEKNVVVMRKGVKGEAVKQLQRRLMELKYYTCTVDGVYDADDIAAVKAFQKKNSLKVDGVAGLQTQLALYSSRAIPAEGSAAEVLIIPTPTPVVSPVATAYTITVPPTKNSLIVGSTGDAVRALQQRLRTLGYYTGKIDGSFGTATAQAVAAFQRANGLTADGVAGPKTLSKINSTGAVAFATPKPAATATPKPIAATILRSGDKSAEVRAMQQRLVDLGYLKAADGIFGIQTYNAVMAFQKRNGLLADGVAGKLTLNKLNSASALPAASTAVATPTPTPKPQSASFKAPSAKEVRNANWYSEIRARAKLMPNVVIYDPDTGLHFNLHMFSFGKHADCETPTAADTNVLNQICGVNKWTPHYVWVIFTDGRVYIGSIHSHGHGVDHTANNNLEGHICLHFPRVMSEAEATGPYAVSHQKEILFGWELTQAMTK